MTYLQVRSNMHIPYYSSTHFPTGITVQPQNIAQHKKITYGFSRKRQEGKHFEEALYVLMTNKVYL